RASASSGRRGRRECVPTAPDSAPFVLDTLRRCPMDSSNAQSHQPVPESRPADDVLAALGIAAGPPADSHGQAPGDAGFDPEQPRLGQDFEGAAGIERVLAKVAVRTPDKSWFVRTHTDTATCWYKTYVIDLKADGETYAVAKDLWPRLMGESTFVARLFV